LHVYQQHMLHIVLVEVENHLLFLHVELKSNFYMIHLIALLKIYHSLKILYIFS
jgi:hypothetical protein